MNTDTLDTARDTNTNTTILVAIARIDCDAVKWCGLTFLLSVEILWTGRE